MGVHRKPVAFGWAVLTPPAWGPVKVNIDSVADTRASAMERFVDDWGHSRQNGLTVSQIWQRAYRRGWRLVRVSITPSHGYAGEAGVNQ